MTEYPHSHYQRDPLHIADALDQIRRRLGKHKIKAPPGTTALPEVPTAFAHRRHLDPATSRRRRPGSHSDVVGD